jgi:hypothetical protein
VFGLGICPLVTLLVPCVFCTEGWPLQPTATDYNMFSMEVRACKYIVMKTVQ